MSTSLAKYKSNILETSLACLILISIVGLGFYFYELAFPNPKDFNPFKTYDHNFGIIKISFASLTSKIIFLSCFILLAHKDRKNHRMIKAVYLKSALAIGFLQWYELYYGSTFYYGEVRDKQGITFPVMASFMVSLVIWKLRFARLNNYDFTIKLILTVTINLGLYLLWTHLYEPWNLFQS